MKKIVISLLSVLLTLSAFGRNTYTDSIDMADIIASDTVIYFNTGKISAGGPFSIEIEYSTLSHSDAVLWLGCSDFGNTFNSLQGWGATTADSIVLNVATDSSLVNGAYPGVTSIVTASQPATQAWMTMETFPFSYVAIKIKPVSVTTGKIYLKIRQL